MPLTYPDLTLESERLFKACGHFNAILEKLIEGVAEFDSTIKGI